MASHPNSLLAGCQVAALKLTKVRVFTTWKSLNTTNQALCALPEGKSLNVYQHITKWRGKCAYWHKNSVKWGQKGKNKLCNISSHTCIFFFLLEIHICYIQFIYNQYLLVSWMTVICQEFINYIILTIWKNITNKILFLKTHSTI